MLRKNLNTHTVSRKNIIYFFTVQKYFFFWGAQEQSREAKKMKLFARLEK